MVSPSVCGHLLNTLPELPTNSSNLCNEEEQGFGGAGREGGPNTCAPVSALPQNVL